MKVVATGLPEVLILEPKVFSDSRGYFLESWNEKTFGEATGVHTRFVQDNHSHSMRHVLRGIHYQVQHPQGKLVRAVGGVVWDVVVDLRRSSPYFGKWTGVELSADKLRLLWIPPGFGHGFVVLSESADFLYKTTEYWDARFERCIIWNDPTIGVDWKLGQAQPLLSDRDSRAPLLRDAEVFA